MMTIETSPLSPSALIPADEAHLGGWQAMRPAELHQAMREHPEALSQILRTQLALLLLAGEDLSRGPGPARANLGAALVFLLARGDLDGALRRSLVTWGYTPWIWLDEADSLEQLQAQTWRDDPFEGAMCLIAGLEYETALKRHHPAENVMGMALCAHALLRPEGFDPATLCRTIAEAAGHRASEDDDWHPLMGWFAMLGRYGAHQVSSEDLQRQLINAMGLVSAREIAAEAKQHTPAWIEPQDAPALLAPETVTVLAQWMAAVPDHLTGLAHLSEVWTGRARALALIPGLPPFVRSATIGAFHEAVGRAGPFGELAACWPQWRELERAPERPLTLATRARACRTIADLDALHAELQAAHQAIGTLPAELRSEAGRSFLNADSLDRVGEALAPHGDAAQDLLLTLAALLSRTGIAPTPAA